MHTSPNFADANDQNDAGEEEDEEYDPKEEMDDSHFFSPYSGRLQYTSIVFYHQCLVCIF